MAAAVYCGACGQTLVELSHDRCEERLRFDPARFCATCGFRLDVQVYPAGVASRCRRCEKAGTSQA